MPAALKLTITTAGRAAIVNAEKNGTTPVVVSQVGMTAVAFTPDASLKNVPNELKRLATISGGATASDTIHVTIRDNTGDTYSLRGLGLYLADGTLFAAYSQADVIGEKSAQASLLLAIDTKFADITATSLSFGDTNYQLNKATNTVLGVVRLALAADAIAGTDTELVVTPAALRGAFDDRLGKGSPTALAKAILSREVAADMRGDLGLKGAALKDEGEGKGLDADLLDGKHGDYYRDYGNLTSRPSVFPPAAHTHSMADIVGLAAALAAKLDVTSRYVPGQIVVSASKTAPAGTLLCNGAALSRATYAALFTAIGTLYGVGDGSTTFNIPSLGEGTVIKATIDANKVGTYSAGSLLTHTHGATAASVADHGHGFTISQAGGHGHSASETLAGDHTHYTWTDAQGYHSHGGWTDAQGNHSHGWGAVAGRYASGASQSVYETANTGAGRTTTDGNHGHNIGTDGQGSHGHNIGMNGAGGHTHTISIGATGDHTHGASLSLSGGHTHNLTIAATGGSDNLAAGTYMFHFIAY